MDEPVERSFGGPVLPGGIHATAIVEDGAVVGEGTRIWHHSHIRSGSRIGERCTVGFAVYVDVGVEIGAGCKIQNHASLYRGLTLEDDVFVGPSVTFTNDRYPRADDAEWDVVPTRVRAGASVGANATVVCGVEIGPRATIGAGSVVVSDVPAHGLVVGNPARLIGWVCRCGRPLARVGEDLPPRCPRCGWVTEGLATT
jgi:UDP-2-acetamido-3-amino-2,3-dideoxy-glucuronate N-acetyltransferase